MVERRLTSTSSRGSVTCSRPPMMTAAAAAPAWRTTSGPSLPAWVDWRGCWSADRLRRGGGHSQPAGHPPPRAARQRPGGLGRHLVPRPGHWGLPGRAPGRSVRFFPLFPLLGRVLAVPFGGPGHVAAGGGGQRGLAGRRRPGAPAGAAREGRSALADRAVWCVALFPAAFVLVLAYAESLMLVGHPGALHLACAGAAGGGPPPSAWPPPWPTAGRAAGRCPPWSRRSAGFGAARAGDRVARLAAVRRRRWSAWWPTWAGWVTSSGTGACPSPCRTPCAGGWCCRRRASSRASARCWGPNAPATGCTSRSCCCSWSWSCSPSAGGRLSYGCYAAAMVLVAMSAQNLNSLERYGMSAFPLLLTLAVLIRPPQVERAALAAMGAGWWRASSMAWLGAYVP